MTFREIRSFNLVRLHVDPEIKINRSRKLKSLKSAK